VREHGIDLTPPDESVVERVPSANDRACIEALRRLAPDVVVVNGTRILSKQILECVPATFLNTHAGITPIYRGVHGGYWALAQNRRDLCGVTVHVVDTGIDTGKIVAQALIEPRPDDSFVTYPYLQTAIALPILVRAVRDAAAGTLTFQRPPAGDSKLWSHPTLGQYLWHRVVDGVR
jgi:folate-dependent phosphoribosylglycinamide formyltransferase PurN